MIPILLRFAVAGMLLLMLIFVIRRYSQGRRHGGPARRQRLASASATADDADIAPLGFFAARDAGDSVEQVAAGGSGTDAGGGNWGCGAAGGNVPGSDMGSTDSGGGYSD